MSMIQVSHLTFGYEGSSDTVFEDVSFTLDTDWKLGLIGRNGKGKTTFLRLLLGELPYQGEILGETAFEYFPFPVAFPDQAAGVAVKNCLAPYTQWEQEMEEAIRQGDMERYGEIQERYMAQEGYVIDELLEREAGKLGVGREALGRPFSQLSGGERTKLMIAALFLKKGRFLLIDEPTNHLDTRGRRELAEYLREKKGFILVSHDRAVLDIAVDHILSLNRCSIELQKGNYSTFAENRRRQDSFELARNQKLERDVKRLRAAARQKAGWSDRVERSKIGSHAADRGFIGHRSAKMMKRAKAIEKRRQEAAEEKEKLLHDLEEKETLKIQSLTPPKGRLIEARGLDICYGGRRLLNGLSFTVEEGERVALTGPNGCGKSSLLKLCRGEPVPHTGLFRMAGGLTVSYLPQETDFLRGDLRGFIRGEGLDESLFKAILRKLDFSREQFLKPMENFIAGQKKKVMMACSLCRPAHLYLWDEPLGFMDLLSRVQVEELLQNSRCTMLFVEHDAAFVEHISTKRVEIWG